MADRRCATDRDLGSSSNVNGDPSDEFACCPQAWQPVELLLVVAVLGLGLYGLWPVLPGQVSQDPAQGDVKAPSSETAIDIVMAERVGFPLHTQATGHLTPWKTATLHAETLGPVPERFVEEGDRLSEGTLLARLQNEEKPITLKEARAELLKACAVYQAKYAGDSPIPLASADTTSNPSLAQRRATEAAVSVITAARRAQLNPHRKWITASVSGCVAYLKVEHGQYVSSSIEVFTLLRDNRMRVAANVLESDLVHVWDSTTAQVHVPTLDPSDDPTAPFEERAWAVSSKVKRQSRTGRVTISIPNPVGRLASGLYVEVGLETKQSTGCFVVPDKWCSYGRGATSSSSSGSAHSGHTSATVPLITTVLGLLGLNTGTKIQALASGDWRGELPAESDRAHATGGDDPV